MRVSITLMILMAISGCNLPTGRQGSAERYEYKVNLPKTVYTDPADPNDQAYSGLVHMTPQWSRIYGRSERSLTLYNWAVMRDRIERVEKAVMSIEKKIEEKDDENDSD